MQRPRVCDQCNRISQPRLCWHDHCRMQLCSTDCHRNHRMKCSAINLPRFLQRRESTKTVIEFVPIPRIDIDNAVKRRIPVDDYIALSVYEQIWKAIVATCDNDRKYGVSFKDHEAGENYLRKGTIVTLRVVGLHAPETWQEQVTTGIENVSTLLVLVWIWLRRHTSSSRASYIAQLLDLTQGRDLTLGVNPKTGLQERRQLEKLFEWSITVDSFPLPEKKLGTAFDKPLERNFYPLTVSGEGQMRLQSRFLLRLNQLSPLLKISSATEYAIFEQALAFALVTVFRWTATFLDNHKGIDELYNVTFVFHITDPRPKYRFRKIGETALVARSQLSVSKETEFYDLRNLFRKEEIGPLFPRILALEVLFYVPF